MLKKISRAFAGVVSAGVSILLALILFIQSILPESLPIQQGEVFYINDKLSLMISSGDRLFIPKVADHAGTLYDLDINAFGSAPVSQTISHAKQRIVIPGGNPFGIKLRTNGIIVVGMTDIQMGTANINPAKEAGLKVGDVLIDINGKKLDKGDDVRDIVTQSGGQALNINILRDGQPIQLTVQPIRSEFDNCYKAGIWVRDSSAGIGTMTYYDPVSGAFAGLGHAVCDIDTGNIMPLASGEVVDVNISGVNAGQSGRPGELKGTFSGSSPLGRLAVNCETGLFGVLNRAPLGHDPIPMAYKHEIVPGPAVILSTISGNKPQSFDIAVEKVNYSDISPTKNIVIRVTDPRLLSATGGIVQGMSGSPIIQNGKLVGAVTHVFVNDPTRGYGIFAENMDKNVKLVENDKYAA